MPAKTIPNCDLEMRHTSHITKNSDTAHIVYNCVASSKLMFMVILGGVATTFGPLLGAITFIILEEVLSTMTIYWHLPFGLLLIGVVMFVKGGLSALMPKAGDKE